MGSVLLCVRAPSVPPVTTMSLVDALGLAGSQTKPVTTSLMVKVMVAVWPTPRLAWLEVMAMVGGVVSAGATPLLVMKLTVLLASAPSWL